MSFLHSHSCECVKSELDLFAVPSTQTSVESGQWIHHKTLSNITDDAPLEFVISAASDSYIDLSQTLLYLNVKITNEDGTNLTQDVDKIIPINNLLHSAFSQIDVYLNQKLVSPPSNLYPYKVIIETLLNYGSEAKTSHLTSSLFYKDTAGHMDNIDTSNEGYTKRFAYGNGSKPFDLIGHLHCDIFNQEKYLLNGVELRVRLVRSRNSFILMGANGKTGKLQINDASLLVRKLKISPTILLAHAKALEVSTAKYPITRTDLKVLTIPAGIQSKSLDNIYLGQLPKRCIIGFVSNRAFNGDFALNPFNFQHFNLNFLSLYLDGQQIPSKPLQPNFNSNDFITMYHTLFSGTGIHFLNEGNAISREDYQNGYCLTAFDLTPDLSASSISHWNLIKNGSLRIELRFDKALTETINCIVYAEFDNIIEIDKNRNVIVDYNN